MAEFEKTIVISMRRCERCGHEWSPSDRPGRICPKCKSSAWNEPRLQHKKPRK